MVRRYRVLWQSLPNAHGYGAGYQAYDEVDAYTAADAVTQVTVKRGDLYRVVSVEPWETGDASPARSGTDG